MYPHFQTPGYRMLNGHFHGFREAFTLRRGKTPQLKWPVLCAVASSLADGIWAVVDDRGPQARVLSLGTDEITVHKNRL